MLYNSICASYYFCLLHPGVLVQQQKCPRAGRINVETIKKTLGTTFYISLLR